MKTKLTTPSVLQVPEDKFEHIVKLIEAKFASNGSFDVSDVPNLRIKRVTIDGYYSLEDCRNVCAAYREVGWTEVWHRRVPDSTYTTFTFKMEKQP